MESLKSKTIQRLQSIEAQPKRSLGQNFLINEHIVERIVGSLNPTEPQTLEVGPGLGAITDEVKSWPNFKVLELDRLFSDYWRNENVEVLEGDALKADWHTLCAEPTQLVSNLPYQISSSIVVMLSCGPDNLNRMVLMFQKEVAQRITSVESCKEYGLLTVMAQNFWSIKKVVDAGTFDFYPKPKINSRVLIFKRKPFEQHGLNEEARNKFLKFVKAAFQQRRKFLLKNIKPYIEEGLKDKVIANLKEWGFDEKVRAENLTHEQFLNLFKLLVQI